MSGTTEQEPTRSVAQRVAELIDQMTVEEKAAQIAGPFASAVDVHNVPSVGFGSITGGLSVLNVGPRQMAQAANELQRKHLEDTRLGIPVLLSEEALVGLKVAGAVSFPDALAQAATWDPALIRQMGDVIGTQMRLLGVRQALSPLADVARDPRWGRIEETYGEEPYLVGSMATAFVQGLQGTGRGVIATLKHFLGYGASEGGRNTDRVHMGEREIREEVALPFEMAIRVGNAGGVMPSYASIDGEPISGSAVYLTDLLRTELGFDGLVIADLGAVNQLTTVHGVAPDPMGAISLALQAGVQIDLDNHVATQRVVDAVQAGVLSEEVLDRAVRQILTTKMNLGLFENPYVDVDAVPESFDAEPERALARQIARESVVLLKNGEVSGSPLLPLNNTVKSIAVIGPNADRVLGQLGNYSYQVLDSQARRFALAADPQARFEAGIDKLSDGTGPDDVELLVDSVPVVTPLAGIRSRAGQEVAVTYARGCGIMADDRSGFAEAVDAARAADVAVVVIGDQSGIGAYGTVGEGIDSLTLELPGVQRELVEQVAATGTPVVAVLAHGRPFVLGWLTECADAIVTTFFGGEEAGNALADVLFGDVNPAGRLPVAFLEHVGAAPIPYWRTSLNDTAIDGSIRSVFAFGHGLSYTTYEYSALTVEADDISTEGTAVLEFTVTNTGERDGDEVVQIYGHDLIASAVRRPMVLVGFQRVHVPAGTSVRVRVEVPAEMFAIWNRQGRWDVEPGEVEFAIGAASDDIRLKTRVTFSGKVAHPGADRKFFSEVSARAIEASDVQEFVQVAAAQADERARRNVKPLTHDSTVKDWLDHPVGGPLLRVYFQGASDEAMSATWGLTLPDMVKYAQGAFPATLVDDLLAQVNK